MHWKDGVQQASYECQFMPDGSEVLSVALLSVEHATAFSYSRWAPVGKSCTTLGVVCDDWLRVLVATTSADP